VVDVIDPFTQCWNPEQFMDEVKRCNPAVVGMTTSTHTFLESVDALVSVKRELPDTTTVMGGIHATFTYDRILREYPEIDHVIAGQGERSFTEYLDALQNGGDVSKVHGLARRGRGGKISLEPARPLDDLNELPFPDREILGDNDYGYTFSGLKLTYGKFTTILTSRGCPFECPFCSCAAFLNRRWQARSVENVADELEQLYSAGYRSLVAVDDNFMVNRTRLLRLCEEIRRRRIRMDIHCEGRVDHADDEVLTAMRRAGVTTIFYGIESGVQGVLDYYKKHITLSQIRSAVEKTKKRRINVIGSFIIGAPVESREDVETTIRFAAGLRCHGLEMSILDMAPGTDFWRQYEERGLIGTDDWKRNHRIYEFPVGLPGDYLLDAQQRAYDMYLDSWKDWGNVSEILGHVILNAHNRKIVWRNLLLNPKTIEVVRGLGKVEHQY